MDEDKKIPEGNTVHGASGGENRFVETYAEDMAQVISDDPGGLVKKIIHEQEEREALKKNLSPDSKRNKIYIITSVVLVVLASTLIYFLVSRNNITTVPVETQFAPLIFHDKSFLLETVGLSSEKITASILAEVRTSFLKDGAIEGIYLTENKQIIGLRSFVRLLKMSLVVPGEPLVSDSFLLGVVSKTNTAKPQNFFLLLKTRALTDIFDSMRTWEGKMFNDLHDLFAVPVNAENSYLLTKSFEDGIVENKNARILYDKNGAVVMMYVFADDFSVVIADNAEAVREVMLRLSAGKLKK